jgi:hypothetical protein
MYLTIRDTARRLSMTEEAPQTFCRRRARRRGRDIVAKLPDGIEALKFGRVWRVRFSKEAAGWRRAQ